MPGKASAGVLFERVTTVILVCAALTLSAFAVADRMRGEPDPSARVSVQEDWEQYVDTSRLTDLRSDLVVVNVFSDYQCVFCKALDAQLEEAREDLGDGVEVHFRHFPLPRHASARQAAIAAECAAQMGAGDDMHRVLFRHQDSLGTLSWDVLAARAHVRDLARFESCMSSEAATARVEADIAAGRNLAITGTPTFMVNQYRVTGGMTREGLLDLVAKARADLGRTR